MSKRYFYTDPLAAAWMAKHHGMNVGIENWSTPVSREDKYFIHPDSLHLLEPQVGDVLYTKLGGGISIEEIISEERQEKSHLIIGRGGCIIQRNGKPFMWPDCEAA